MILYSMLNFGSFFLMKPKLKIVLLLGTNNISRTPYCENGNILQPIKCDDLEAEVNTSRSI